MAGNDSAGSSGFISVKTFVGRLNRVLEATGYTYASIAEASGVNYKSLWQIARGGQPRIRKGNYDKLERVVAILEKGGILEGIGKRYNGGLGIVSKKEMEVIKRHLSILVNEYGWSLAAIGREIGVTGSTVHNWYHYDGRVYKGDYDNYLDKIKAICKRKESYKRHALREDSYYCKQDEVDKLMVTLLRVKSLYGFPIKQKYLAHTGGVLLKKLMDDKSTRVTVKLKEALMKDLLEYEAMCVKMGLKHRNVTPEKTKELFKRIKKVMDDRGFSVAELSRFLGLPFCTISSWQKRPPNTVLTVIYDRVVKSLESLETDGAIGGDVYGMASKTDVVAILGRLKQAVDKGCTIKEISHHYGASVSYIDNLRKDGVKKMRVKTYNKLKEALDAVLGEA